MKARDNPFSVERVHSVRYRPLRGTFEGILARLETLEYRAALVGPEGSGKSTLLEDLRNAVAQQGRETRLVFVNDTCPLDAPRRRQLLCEATADEIVFLDGADSLRWAIWLLIKRRLLRETAGLVITSHRSGMLPTLLECSTTPLLLQQIVGALGPEAPPVSTGLLNDLYHRHDGNLRHCLRDLYDLYAQHA